MTTQTRQKRRKLSDSPVRIMCMATVMLILAFMIGYGASMAQGTVISTLILLASITMLIVYVTRTIITSRK